MARPTNIVSTSPGPIVNLTINGENGSTPNSQQGDSESVVGHIIACRADHEIYCHQLMTKKRGYPLWVPGPGMQLPVEYRRQGISIGDVGIITPAGDFDFLFNLFQPPNHPINIGFVPSTFTPLPSEDLRRDIQKTRVYGPNSSLATCSSVRKTVRRNWFKPASSSTPVDQIFSTSGEAAILTMPEGASTHNLLNTLHIRQCISENARNWYQYARHERGRTVRNGDIRVVVGIDKVKSWGIATSTCNAGQTASMTFKHDRGLNRTRFYSWDCTGGSGRVGPEETEIDDLIQNNLRPQNQCVFLRAINFTVSGDIWDELLSETVVQSSTVSGQGERRPSESADASRAPGASSRRPTTSVSFGSMEHGVDSHPSTALHECLHHKFPGARVVITEDSDWISALHDNDTHLPEPKALVARILKSTDQSEHDGIVTIRMKDEYSHQDDGDSPNSSSQPTAIRNTAAAEGDLELTRTRSVTEQSPLNVLRPLISRESENLSIVPPSPTPMVNAGSEKDDSGTGSGSAGGTTNGGGRQKASSHSRSNSTKRHPLVSSKLKLVSSMRRRANSVLSIVGTATGPGFGIGLGGSRPQRSRVVPEEEEKGDVDARVGGGDVRVEVPGTERDGEGNDGEEEFDALDAHSQPNQQVLSEEGASCIC